MNKQTQKKVLVMLGALGGVTVIGVAAVAVWNSRRMRMMRIIKRTNTVMNRVGHALCRLSDAAGECG